MGPRWLYDVGAVLLTAVGVIIGFVVFVSLPVGLLFLLPPEVVEGLCSGAFFCLPTLTVFGTVSVGIGLAVLGWLYRRGYLTLPDAW